jgi:hypothetical protein
MSIFSVRIRKTTEYECVPYEGETTAKALNNLKRDLSHWAKEDPDLTEMPYRSWSIDGEEIEVFIVDADGKEVKIFYNEGEEIVDAPEGYWNDILENVDRNPYHYTVSIG